MAGAGYKLFNTGDVLTAAQVNTYLNEQTVMVFADSAARTTALSGVLSEGMMSYLQDTDSVEVYDGSAWTAIGGGSSPLTTKGDLYTFSTVDARLGVGANGTVLQLRAVRQQVYNGLRLLVVERCCRLFQFQIQQALMLTQVSRQQLHHQQQQAKF
jgi:hypothetical protein